MELPSLPLKGGGVIPLIGFGTGTAWYKDDPEDPFNPDLVEVLTAALGKHFIHLDCADSYGTERELAAAIKASGLPREKLFITTKVQDGWDDVPAAMDKSLKNLELEYVDLYLLHNPYVIPTPHDLQNAWKGLESIKASSKARAIGVSNMQRNHIETILETASEVPVINQIEFHPYLQRTHDFLPWMRERGIEVSSFKGLAPITVGKGGPLDEPLARIAEAHGVSPAVVLLRWALNQNVVVITTTSKPERMDEYAQAIALTLSPDEQEEITRVGLSHHFRWWGRSFFDPDDRS